ncbi:hypothetical protein SKAU_G00370110 [Synaphobranchus kaupii]|uniref:Membrane-anchored junction protein n=1 Tax=Synaphobranchus kaupii TaxID=118154 RepID=A0A9Q1EFX4_SYNKA|nr:hypothetical protein SKAU_G00370110 [Synaphobranchus kaupii]
MLTMPIQSFSFPLPETRFFRAGRHIYKFKLKSGSKCSDENIDNEHVTQELEDAVRVVLANLDSLQPFATQHFNIFPYKSKWERVSELQFEQGGLRLVAYPFLLTLYLETHGELHAHTAKQPRDWTPVRAAEQGVLHLPHSLACQHKSSRTGWPQGGSPTQHRWEQKWDMCRLTAAVQRRPSRRPLSPVLPSGRDWDPPQRTAGAEATAGDRRVPGHLSAAQTTSVSSNAMQREWREEGGVQNEREGLTRTAEQSEPQRPAPSDSERGQPGVLANLARKLFPFSLFFGSWKK